jgi:hypothetical protein
VDPTLTAAVAALRQRPVLFKYCAEEVAGARHGALFQRFIIALTRGGPGGVPAPIEIHAHDPRRYVADMMAWAHQALAGEREFVAALFGEGGGDGDGGAPQQQQPQAQGQQQGQQPEGGAAAPPPGGDVLSSVALLDRIFEGVCRPLRVRVEQVLMMSPPLLLCFQLAQLGGFYHDLVVRILGPGAALSTTIAGCRDAARRAFFEQLRAGGDRLLRAPAPPGADLAPPPAVSAALGVLAEIVAAHEGALGRADAGGGDDGFGPVLDAVLDPLLEACRRSSDALRPDSGARLDDAPAHSDPAAQPTFMLNCVAAVQAALAPHACCAGRAAALAATADDAVRQLVRGEVARLLARCGLAEIAERMRVYQVGGLGVGVGRGPELQPRAGRALRHACLAPLPRRGRCSASSSACTPLPLRTPAPRRRRRPAAAAARSPPTPRCRCTPSARPCGPSLCLSPAPTRCPSSASCSSPSCARRP